MHICESSRKMYNPIRFIPQEKSDFYTTVKKRVESYFSEKKISRNANSAMVLKSIVLIAAYVFSFIIILFAGLPWGVNLLFWSIMGFSLAGIGMSVMHDANHGAYSKSAIVNYIMGHTLTMIGGSVFNWKLQHNNLHHMFTNIVHVDDDISDKPMLRFSPHTKVNATHRFQHLYCIFFYGISTFYWILAKDFMQLYRYSKFGVNKSTPSQNRWVIARLLISKIAYFFVMLVVPTLFLKIPFYQVIVGYLLMHFISGIVLTFVFQLAHTVEGTTHPLPIENGIIENDWAIHQMETTMNFAPDNKILSWYVGGLNYQVEHHLFPKVCHVHYPQIAAIVKQTASEFGIKYLEHKSFKDALNAHFQMLARFGKLPTLDEAIAG